MTYEQIHNLFKQRYNQTNWKQFLSQAFANTRLLAKPEILTGIDPNVASQVQKLGYITLNENGIERQIAVYEVTLAQGIILERNRVGLRNLLRKYWKDIDAAFITYHNSEKANWRFTYVSELTGYDADGEFIKIKTEPKRYTYVLGEGESTRTAAERFTAIAKKGNNATLDDVKEAFSVEKLSKAFFDEYKKHYDIFCDFMVSSPNIRQTLFNGDEKGIRDFNKKLLGRIVFLYFIQKKGWLGVPATDDWGKGDFNFLTQQFENFRNKDLFYQDFLSILFFETLNCKRENDIFDYDNSQFITHNSSLIKIPYLNGGLFEEDDQKHRNLIFPANLFKNLFDFFNQYNFTIYEDDPNDHTVAVDPEMLGHIFENLLEDNKDKGAFYTPKEIVHYMCQESLIEYLFTNYESSITNDEFLITTEEAKILITDFIKKKEIDVEALKKTSKTEESYKYWFRQLNDALDTVKICDPAIGSGAFPMGLLHEIVTAKQTLHTFEHGNTKTFEASAVKLNIIQNSIYGVDIERGAVDIARLRFWLSLIVDEEKPKALPNLDYKIVVGNSLVSKLGDDIIDIDWTLNETTHGLFGADLAKQKGDLLRKISEEQKEFFSPNSDKKKLADDIRNLKIDLLITQLELMISTKGIETQPTGTARNIAKQTELYLQTIGWKNSIKDLQKLKSKPELPLHFFDWKLDFPEVMNEQVVDNVGFDIVIGNPPYISYYGNTSSTLSGDEKKYFVNHFDSVQKENDRINSMNLFSEKGLNIIKRNGNLAFIVNKTMAVLPSYSFFRDYFLKNVTFKYSITDLIPFEAIVDCFIFSINNDIPILDYEFKFFKGDIENYSIQTITTFHKNKKKEFHIPKNEAILDAIEKAPSFLSEILTINRGVNIGGCFDFFLSKKKENQKYEKYLSGTKCIKPYNWEWTSDDGYMIFDEKQEKILRTNGKTIALGNHDRYLRPKLFIPESAQKIMVAYTEETIYSAYGLLVGTTELDIMYLKYVCGLLNSTLITYYSIQREILRKGNKATPHVGVKGLNGIPIFQEEKSVKLISKVVDKILFLKSEGKDTTALEQEIDNLVYKLYELTYEEVKVIDPDFGLSKAEYEAIVLA